MFVGLEKRRGLTSSKKESQAATSSEREENREAQNEKRKEINRTISSTMLFSSVTPEGILLPIFTTRLCVYDKYVHSASLPPAYSQLLCRENS